MLRESEIEAGGTTITVDTTSPLYSGYIAVNSLQLYYETSGIGEPLIMLHGGLGGIAEFGSLPGLLSLSRQVIAVELQGHAHTADIDRPLHYQLMADDIAAVIEHLGLGRTDVLGFSLGGSVALQLAMHHPNNIRKLILISTPLARNAIHDEIRAGMAGLNAHAAPFMLDTPMYQLYSSTAPDASAWHTLVDKVGTLLRQDYDWSTQASTIKTPKLIVVGDSDIIPVSHVTDVFGATPDSQIIVIPQTSHFNIMSRIDVLVPAITAFLDSSVQKIS